MNQQKTGEFLKHLRKETAHYDAGDLLHDANQLFTLSK